MAMSPYLPNLKTSIVNQVKSTSSCMSNKNTLIKLFYLPINIAKALKLLELKYNFTPNFFHTLKKETTACLLTHN